MKIAPFFRLMRLHQPVGAWLLLWPCGWSVAMAGPRLPSIRLLLLFGLGAFLMRAAGCIINDLWDRKIDAEVERTRSRPLASGEVSPLQAMILLLALLGISLGIAVALGPRVVAGAALALPLVVAYPLMKRITWWPQAFLGLTFNWGALLGTVAVQGRVTLPALLLYAGGVCWTLGYDTIYAHQDKADDVRVGVKSTALLLGEATKRWLWRFYGAAVACWTLAGALAGMGMLYFALMTVTAAHFSCQIRGVSLDEPTSCRAKFASNAWLGFIVFTACVLGRIS